MPEEKKDKELEGNSQNPSDDQKSSQPQDKQDKKDSDLKAKLEELTQKNKELYARAVRAESMVKSLKSALEEQEDGSDKQVKQEEKKTDDSWKELVEFRVDHPELSKEDIELISRFRKDGETLAEAYNRQEVKDFIAFQQNKMNEQKKPLNPSSPAGSPSPKDISKMSREEHKKLDEEAVKANRDRYSSI